MALSGSMTAPVASADPARPLRVVLIAGEASGDLLGAALVEGLRRLMPDVVCTGMTGPRMRAAGCENMADISELSVMGLVEVVRVLPRILRLRRRLRDEILAMRPDVVVGIDAPDFNLPLERHLRRCGIPAVHMVSPTIWAWRAKRRFRIADSCDAVLCLYPFEPACYSDTAVRAEYIGHPLADELDDGADREAARAALGLSSLPAGSVVGVLPGSRAAEVRRIMPRFAAAMDVLARGRPELTAVVAVSDDSLRAPIETIAAQYPAVRWELVDGQSRQVMRASDALMVASGTATLEALLLGRPMVVSYVAAPFSAWLMRRFRLLKTPYISLPNILSGRETVPELLQEAATPESLANVVCGLLDDPERRRRQQRDFDHVRNTLGRDAGARAAEVIRDVASA